MSNISELANVPQISFIENMTLQETEEQLKAEYARIYREQTGKELVLGEADAKTLLLKAFALIEYQTMQYADIKGQAELLKTSTGEALDALVALLGLTRQESKKATAKERFLLAEARADTVAVPAGTRVKTQGGRYFNTLDYAEIPPGATYVDTIVQAEEAGAESSGILAGEINILVDPIPYIPRRHRRRRVAGLGGERRRGRWRTLSHGRSMRSSAAAWRRRTSGRTPALVFWRTVCSRSARWQPAWKNWP